MSIVTAGFSQQEKSHHLSNEKVIFNIKSIIFLAFGDVGVFHAEVDCLKPPFTSKYIEQFLHKCAIKTQRTTLNLPLWYFLSFKCTLLSFFSDKS